MRIGGFGNWHFRLRLALGLVAGAVLFVFLVGNSQSNRSTAGQAPFGKAAKDIDDQSRPTVDFADSSNKRADEVRKKKNTRYNGYGIVKAKPEPDAEVIWDSDWSHNLSDLPTDKSDVVVEGVIVDSNAFLSEDQSGIYSEFSISISRVFKAPGDFSIPVGSTVTAERFGGKVRYPSGQIVTYRIDGQGFPIVTKRYIFFLVDGGQDNYKLLTAYEIVGEKVYALDGSRINFRGAGNWKFDKHNGEGVDSFIAKVISMIGGNSN